MTIGNEFTRDEVDSIYVHADERYVVSLIVGYGDESVKSPIEAAAAALNLTLDEGQDGTIWQVYDRSAKTMHTFQQGTFADDAAAEL